MSGIPVEAVTAEVDRREAAEMTDLGLASFLLQHCVVTDTMGIGSIQNTDGSILHPIQTSLPEVSASRDYSLLDGNLAIPMAVLMPPTVRGTFALIHPETERAEVHVIEEDLNVSEHDAVSTPFGTLATSILDEVHGSGFSIGRIPGEGEAVFSTYMYLDEIQYELPKDTTVTFSFPESKSEEHDGSKAAVIDIHGFVNVRNPMAYQKVAGDKVMHSKDRDSREALLVELPEELATLDVRVPQECDRIVNVEGRLLALRADNGTVIEAGTTMAEIYAQANMHSQHVAMVDRLAELGITIIELPDLDVQAHRAIADALGWVDDTERFLDSHRYAIDKRIQRFADERINQLGQDAVRGALTRSMENEDAQVEGPSAVSRYLRDRIRDQEKIKA